MVRSTFHWIKIIPVLAVFFLWGCGDIGSDSSEKPSALPQAPVQGTDAATKWKEVFLPGLPAGVQVFESEEPDGAVKRRVVLDGNNSEIKKLLEDGPGSTNPLDAEFFKKAGVSSAVLQGVDKIGSKMFERWPLQEVNIPDSVTEIGERAFEGNDLKALALPDTLKTIGKDAFSGNELKELVIPKSVEDIGEGAFFTNLLERVTLTQEQLNDTIYRTVPPLSEITKSTFAREHFNRSTGLVEYPEPRFFNHSGVEIFRQP